MMQNEMNDTQIQNELGFKVRENIHLNNTDKKPLPVLSSPCILNMKCLVTLKHK